MNATPTDGTIDGQQLQAQGTFSYANGTTGTFVEVDLNTAGSTDVGSSATNGAGSVIVGSSNNDTLVAAPGSIMTGGAGNDTFVFKSIADSQPGAGHFDTITDFTHNSDHIDLSSIAGATNVQGQVAEANTVAANSVSWFVDNPHNQTIVYVNTTAHGEPRGYGNPSRRHEYQSDRLGYPSPYIVIARCSAIAASLFNLCRRGAGAPG